jgi:hypothetical protein
MRRRSWCLLFSEGRRAPPRRGSCRTPENPPPRPRSHQRGLTMDARGLARWPPRLGGAPHRSRLLRRLPGAESSLLGLLIEAANSRLWLDAGLHPDHWTDLPLAVHAIAVGAAERERPLPIYGPTGWADAVGLNLHWQDHDGALIYEHVSPLCTRATAHHAAHSSRSRAKPISSYGPRGLFLGSDTSSCAWPFASGPGTPKGGRWGRPVIRISAGRDTIITPSEPDRSPRRNPESD